MGGKNAYVLTMNGVAYHVEIECLDRIVPPPQKQSVAQADIVEMGRPAPWVVSSRFAVQYKRRMSTSM